MPDRVQPDWARAAEVLRRREAMSRGRITDPITTKLAAEQVKPSHLEGHLSKDGPHIKALNELRATDLNAYELTRRTNLAEISECPWKRVSELKKYGYAAPNGERRRGKTNRLQEVLTITVKGIEELRYHREQGWL